MSADNWAPCPKCTPVIDEEEDDDYGPLREDYEIGVQDGRLVISYSGHCYNCGFRVRFKLDRPVDELGE